MKKIFTLILLNTFLFFPIKGWSQMSFISNSEYGQIFDVLYDPLNQNVIYGKTLTNHIVKTSNHGESWEIVYSFPINTHYALLKDLRFTPDNKNLSFIVRAQGSIHNKLIILDPKSKQILKEITSPNNDLPQNLIETYSITGDRYQNILLHTTYIFNFGYVSEVFYSKDGGSHWDTVYDSPYRNNVHINNVVIHPNNPNRLFLMRGQSPNNEQGGLWISQDSGASWVEKIPGNSYHALSFDPLDENKMFLGTTFGSGNHTQNLYRSNNGGESWQIVPINWTDYSQNSIQSISFNPKNNKEIIILEENEIAISNNGGQTWQNFLHDPTNLDGYFYGLQASFNPYKDGEILISSNYYPFISQDGGRTLSKYKTPFVNSTGNVSIHNNTETNLYHGVRQGYIVENLKTHEKEEIGLHPIDFVPNLRENGIFPDQWISGRVYKSYTNGMGMSSFVVSPDHGKTVYSAHSGLLLNIFKIAGSKKNPNHVWAALGESVWKFDFTDLDNIIKEEVILPHYGLINSIIIDEEDDNKVIISQNTNTYTTTDGGIIWTASEKGLEHLVKDIDFIYDMDQNPHDKKQYLLSTTQGIFISDDAGKTWSNLYNANVINKARFSPYKKGVIVATSTFMNGDIFPEAETTLMYSENNGGFWSIINAEKLNHLFAESSEIVFTENKADIYFSTQDLGLVKYAVEFENLNTAENNTLSKTSVIIYPNPTSDKIYVKSVKPVKTIQILDVTGKLITTVNQSQVIDLADYNEGNYFIKISLNDGEIITRKIIKN